MSYLDYMNCNGIELNKTVDGMLSGDYKERFVAEYWQTKIRYEKLYEMCVKYEAGMLNFTPKCSLELLKAQRKHMRRYLECLEVRAMIEDIDLNWPWRDKANSEYVEMCEKWTKGESGEKEG